MSISPCRNGALTLAVVRSTPFYTPVLSYRFGVSSKPQTTRIACYPGSFRFRPEAELSIRAPRGLEMIIGALVMGQ